MYEDIGVPMAPDKTFGPATTMIFVGYEIDGGSPTAVLILACGLAGIPRNTSSGHINLKTVRPPARRKKKPGAFLNDRRDIENSQALYFANIQWTRKQAYNNFIKSSIS